MLVYVRPSNEALLRARVPGAQDQRGSLPIFFTLRVLRARRMVGGPLSLFQLVRASQSSFMKRDIVVENRGLRLMGRLHCVTYDTLFVKREGNFVGCVAGEKGEVDRVFYLSESRSAR